MKKLMSAKTTILFPLALLSAALVTPASANWFRDPDSNIRRHVPSAPSPTPQDLRGYKHYPASSLLQGEEGTVALRISLTEQGKVSDAVVVKSSGFPRLDDAAVQYVKADWRYDPAENEQMPAVVQTNVTFELKSF